MSTLTGLRIPPQCIAASRLQVRLRLHDPLLAERLPQLVRFRTGTSGFLRMKFHAEMSNGLVPHLAGLYHVDVVYLVIAHPVVARRVRRRENLVQARPKSPRNQKESHGLEKGLLQPSVTRLLVLCHLATSCQPGSRLVRKSESKLKTKRLLHSLL